MCSIIGALLWGLDRDDLAEAANDDLAAIWRASHARGRDGRGYVWLDPDLTASEEYRSVAKVERGYSGHLPIIPEGATNGALIGNLRAEPTTEWVESKTPDDQQPYSCGSWSIVHNGTIANDKELRTGALPTKIDSAAIAEALNGPGFAGHSPDALFRRFKDTLGRLKGSYAIIAAHARRPDMLLVGANYRPLWWALGPGGFYFASSRDFFPAHLKPQMLEPYTAALFEVGYSRPSRVETLRPASAFGRQKTLVIASGGLDSTVAAAALIASGHKVELIHFQYGSRAEGPEVEAVRAVAEALGVPCTLFPLGIYDPADSPLLRADGDIAGGEAGAEFAHEWVPARNLVMLSVATAYAEAKGFNAIALGNNLEEAGAYPDNEPEFIARFNDLLPFAVGDGKRMEVLMPVGNLMKHEIVELGNAVGAPLDKTWSCYRAGDEHCGTCGPCFMRRTAFAINDLPEVINYQNGEKPHV